MARTRDLAIFVTTTDDTDCFTPCACTRGKLLHVYYARPRPGRGTRTDPRNFGGWGALTREKKLLVKDGSSAAVGIPFDSGVVSLLDSRGYVKNDV